MTTRFEAYWWAYRKRHHEPELALLPALCERNALALDIGANKGLYTHYLNKLGARVVAFEPAPAMAQRLGLIYPKVRIEQVALSEHTGSAELRLPGDNYSWGTIEPRNELELATQPIRTIQVKLAPLDSFKFDKVSLIKIDVEGHEEGVLRGGLDTLRSSQPVLVIEIEERHKPGAIASIAKLTSELGYHGFFIDGKALRPLSEFDVQRDQNVANVSEQGRAGRYLNNFLFIPEHALKHRLSRLSDLGVATPRQLMPTSIV